MLQATVIAIVIVIIFNVIVIVYRLNCDFVYS